MEKMIWAKPEMSENVFPANAYCAMCGTELSYNFVCDAGRVEKENPLYPYIPGSEPTYWSAQTGDLTNADGTVNFTDSEKHEDWLGDSTYASYSACLEEHQASTEDEYVLGRFYANGGNNNLTGAFKQVYIWFESLGNNKFQIHATENIQKETWQYAYSA